MNIIELNYLELKTFNKQDAVDYCSLNNINPLNIIELNLRNNELTDISGIKLFKNLEILNLEWNDLTNISVIKYLTDLQNLNISNNKIKDISAIQHLINLKVLNIRYLKLESDQIEYFKSLKKLKTLWCFKGFKYMNILDKLNKNIEIFKYS